MLAPIPNGGGGANVATVVLNNIPNIVPCAYDCIAC